MTMPLPHAVHDDVRPTGDSDMQHAVALAGRYRITQAYVLVSTAVVVVLNHFA